MPARRIAQIATVEPVTLAEAKLHTRSDCAEDDPQLTDLIAVAREAAEDRLGRTLLHARWRLTVDAFSPALELPNPRIVQVESVTYIDPNGLTRTLDPLDYLVDTVSEPGFVVPAPGRTWPATQDRINAVEVVYVAGYGLTASTVPKPIKQWMLLAIGDMYANRERSAERPAVPQDFADGLLDTYKIWSL